MSKLPRIDSRHLRAVCRIGQHAGCCRYIVADRHGFGCAKHEPVLSVALNVNAGRGLMTALGDNCEGLRP